MTVEERIRFLLRAALRAEREGAARAARSLRLMAEQARPLEHSTLPLIVDSNVACCAE
jgi:hypothetical protein